MTDVPAPLTTAIRGVVFDLDGTLVDSYGAITESLNHARAAFGLEPLGEPEVRRTVGRGLESLVADLVGPGHVEAAVRLFRERYAQVFSDSTFLLPGVARTLERLHADGYALAVASNKPVRFTTPILEHLDIARFFTVVHGPDTVGRTKPDPTMIRSCLEDMEVGTAAALYVGDMPLDAESADRAGVAVMLVPGGSADLDALRRTGRPVLTSIGDLPDRLLRAAPDPPHRTNPRGPSTPPLAS